MKPLEYIKEAHRQLFEQFRIYQMKSEQSAKQNLDNCRQTKKALKEACQKMSKAGAQKTLDVIAIYLSSPSALCRLFSMGPPLGTIRISLSVVEAFPPPSLFPTGRSCR